MKERRPPPSPGASPPRMNVALVERKLCSSPQFATRPAAAGATYGGAPENEGVEHGR